MNDSIKDSVEAALELDEKEVYSHIAHESAEDMRRIISSIDAERAKKKGYLVYYQDDWDDLIRERIRKGKRHTAFDFYNPSLLDIWEEKVEELKNVKKAKRFLIGIIGLMLALAGILTAMGFWYILPVAVGLLPLVVWVLDRAREKSDLIYHQLTQFFIDEMRALVSAHRLNPEKYRFKLFTEDYFGVRKFRLGRENFFIVEPLEDNSKNL